MRIPPRRSPPRRSGATTSTSRCSRTGISAVVETIVYDFGAEQRHGIYREIPTRLHYDDTYDRVFPLHVDSVSGSPGTPVGYTTEDAGDGKTGIKIGDPDQLITGVHEYAIAYTVQGALNAFPNRDELYWNAIGDEWSVTIQRASVRVSAPGPITGVACFQGQGGSTDACQVSAYQGSAARFGEPRLFPGQGLTVVVGITKGAAAVQPPILQERWSPTRAFSLTPVTGSAAGGIALAGICGFGYLVWTRGRDRRYQGSQVDQIMGNPDGTSEPVPAGDADAEGPVEFAPPDGIRPGQIGTLIDERANTIDVSATIVDLAVRGFLRIEEIPKQGFFGKPDWRLTRSDADDASLLPYERMLLQGLFRDGTDTTLSALRTTFAERLSKVEDSLYADARDQGLVRDPARQGADAVAAPRLRLHGARDRHHGRPRRYHPPRAARPGRARRRAWSSGSAPGGCRRARRRGRRCSGACAAIGG